MTESVSGTKKKNNHHRYHNLISWQAMLKGKNIVVGITGGIAAYKIPYLIRSITKAGGNVRVVMTESAKEFVTPQTLSTLSGNEVVVGTFPEETGNVVTASTWHITLSQWANVMLIAPATANTIAKLAHGYADNAVTTLALALRCPLVISPSMDIDMWHHPKTELNLTHLKEQGCTVLPPDKGELASGLVGPGRLPELEIIVKTLDAILRKNNRDLEGKKVVVTAGPTHEAIDPVRYIGNRSSGKMGFAIANAAAQRGANVTMIAGPVRFQTPRNVERIDVESAEEMYRAVNNHTKNADAIIMAAAVADFTPVAPAKVKIKRNQRHASPLTLELKTTKDILQHYGNKKKGGVLVGFALETNRELYHAKKKLKEKNLDLIVMNNPLVKGAAFDTDTNVVTIISKNGRVEKLPRMQKFDVANTILDKVSKLLSH